MIYNKRFFVDVKFEVDAPSGEKAIEWLEQELRLHQDSDVVEYWTITSVVEDFHEELDDENI